ncbi:hypothetical protein IP92_05409 [Pseudoduganella flava]|uniref:Phasin family protein n=1 Tax=Pseudoduganella flava TaxID=871742 RepID=A0A562PDL7_9BURK|nr:hypothetical protein [Pseudoduganella flava]QGZ42184.1 hypothetical protein GO485_26165 [Pseudoduganella flava]TWI42433.1 hypothetical protein IP92_05409 [Pseudoduganella flava]
MPIHPLAPWCALGKSALLMAQQWQDASAAAMTALLKTQLDMIDTRQAVQSLQGYADLYQGVADNLATQRHELSKAVIERAAACVEDLRRAGSQDDVAIVLNGFLQDVGARVKENTEQAATVLNAAQSASVVLAHQALDGAAGDGAAPSP